MMFEGARGVGNRARQKETDEAASLNETQHPWWNWIQMGPTHFGHHYRCWAKLEMAIFWMGMETKRRAQLRCCYHWFWAVFFKNVGHNLQKQNQVTKHPTPSMPSSCPRRRIGRRTELANLLHYDTEKGEGGEILEVVITARIESSDTLSTLVLHKILWLSVNQFSLNL